MHNQHIWKETTAEGEKREVRAIKFGGVWTIQAKLKNDAEWTYYKEALTEDLRVLNETGQGTSPGSFEEVCLSLDAGAYYLMASNVDLSQDKDEATSLEVSFAGLAEILNGAAA